MTGWNNKKEVLKKLEYDGGFPELEQDWYINSLQCASEELRADRGVVLAAVKKWGDDLQYASEELRADREVVLAAVKDWSEHIEFASEELRADPEIAIAAIESVCSGDETPAFGIHEVLMKDKEFMLRAIDINDYTGNSFILIARAHKDLWKEKEFVLLAIEVIRHAHTDEGLFFYLQRIDPFCQWLGLDSLLGKIDNSLKTDSEIAFEIAKCDVQGNFTRLAIKWIEWGLQEKIREEKVNKVRIKVIFFIVLALILWIYMI